MSAPYQYTQYNRSNQGNRQSYSQIPGVRPPGINPPARHCAMGLYRNMPPSQSMRAMPPVPITVPNTCPPNSPNAGDSNPLTSLAVVSESIIAETMHDSFPKLSLNTQENVNAASNVNNSEFTNDLKNEDVDDTVENSVEVDQDDVDNDQVVVHDDEDENEDTQDAQVILDDDTDAQAAQVISNVQDEEITQTAQNPGIITTKRLDILDFTNDDSQSQTQNPEIDLTILSDSDKNQPTQQRSVRFDGDDIEATPPLELETNRLSIRDFQESLTTALAGSNNIEDVEAWINTLIHNVKAYQYKIKHGLRVHTKDSIEYYTMVGFILQRMAQQR